MIYRTFNFEKFTSLKSKINFSSSKTQSTVELLKFYLVKFRFIQNVLGKGCWNIATFCRWVTLALSKKDYLRKDMDVLWFKD